MNDFPIRLKPEDSPPPSDPQTVAIEHTAHLRDMAEQAHDLVVLLTRWGDDPTAVFRRAQARAHELAEQAARAEESGERLTQAHRHAGLFSLPFTVNSTESTR